LKESIKGAGSPVNTGLDGSCRRFALQKYGVGSTLYWMKKEREPSELMAVLDYILNRCTLREIDAVQTAVERRRKDLAASGGIISLDPARAAREMSGAVQQSIDTSMDSIRETFRNFAADLIAREAPELTSEQAASLVESWMPQSLPRRTGESVYGDEKTGGAPGATGGKINNIPADALYAMAIQFISYSTGSMMLSEQESLREVLGDWTAVYWKKFPSEVKSLIKSYLDGSVSGNEFEMVLKGLLGV